MHASVLLGRLSQLILSDPFLLVTQVLIGLLCATVLFLLFYTLRDILLRTHALSYQFFCILLVAVFPIIGFLLYLLIRPARTVMQRETDRKTDALWQTLCAQTVTTPQTPIVSRDMKDADAEHTKATEQVLQQHEGTDDFHSSISTPSA